VEGEGEAWGGEVDETGWNSVCGSIEVLNEGSGGVVGKGGEIERVWLVG
jgi:hypothetical protein